MINGVFIINRNNVPEIVYGKKNKEKQMYDLITRLTNALRNFANACKTDLQVFQIGKNKYYSIVDKVSGTTFIVDVDTSTKKKQISFIYYASVETTEFSRWMRRHSLFFDS